MNLLGDSLVLLAFVALAAVMGLALASIRRGPGSPYMELGRRSMYVAAAALLTAMAVLLHLLVTHDFSNEYVAGYTDRQLPLLYLVTALWGGQKGSLLFWATAMTGFSSLALARQKARAWVGEPWALFMLGAISMFFVVALVFAVPPFERFLVLGRLPDGDGLNPLLQDPAMIYHPPTILLGYAIWGVPFAYALAALVVGDSSAGWMRSMRTWSVVGWFFLTMGNLFGAFWAYNELGWGGFWGWDPVENASLMPWFTATAFLHLLMVVERRGKMKLAAHTMLMTTFMLTILGTFITRTGIIESVHAFGSGSALGTMFLVFMVLVVVVWLGLILWRFRALTDAPRLDSWLSQESAIGLFGFLMVFATVVVLWGTLFPTIYELLGGGKVTIGTDWFNRNTSPLGLLILLLIALSPLLGWTRTRARRFWVWFGGTFGGALGLTLAEHVALGVSRSWYHPVQSMWWTAVALVGLLGVNFVVVTLVFDLWRAVARRGPGQGIPRALVTRLLKARRRYGGYVIHAGIALLMVGFLGQVYKTAKDEVQLAKGRSFTMGAYTITMNGLRRRQAGPITVTEALVDVVRDGRPVGRLYPAQFLFVHQGRQYTTEVDTYGNLLEDLYLALVGYDMGKQVAVLKVVVNPLVLWLWIGAVVAALGTGLVLLPERLVERLLAAMGRR